MRSLDIRLGRLEARRHARGLSHLTEVEIDARIDALLAKFHPDDLPWVAGQMRALSPSWAEERLAVLEAATCRT